MAAIINAVVPYTSPAVGPLISRSPNPPNVLANASTALILKLLRYTARIRGVILDICSLRKTSARTSTHSDAPASTASSSALSPAPN